MNGFEILELIYNRRNTEWLDTINIESANIIKSKIQEVPSTYFEHNITIDENRICLIDFIRQTLGISPEKRKRLMEKYNINYYDVKKLQTIIDSIKVASEYGGAKESFNKEGINKSYGISLSDSKSLDKAYPLWIAYLYADSKSPYEDIKMRLVQDGTDDKYTPEYILRLIEHTNLLLDGKTISEKKDFFISSISGILDEGVEINISNKDEIEI